jgi:hypothetical protein
MSPCEHVPCPCAACNPQPRVPTAGEVWLCGPGPYIVLGIVYTLAVVWHAHAWDSLAVGIVYGVLGLLVALAYERVAAWWKTRKAHT